MTHLSGWCALLPHGIENKFSMQTLIQYWSNEKAELQVPVIQVKEKFFCKIPFETQLNWKTLNKKYDSFVTNAGCSGVWTCLGLKKKLVFDIKTGEFSKWITVAAKKPLKWCFRKTQGSIRMKLANSTYSRNAVRLAEGRAGRSGEQDNQRNGCETGRIPVHGFAGTKNIKQTGWPRRSLLRSVRPHRQMGPNCRPLLPRNVSLTINNIYILRNLFP